MIKYLGSKRVLVPAIARIVRAIPEVRTVCDLFAGTTRVGQGLKRAGLAVVSNDLASYSEVLGRAFIETDSRDVDPRGLGALFDHLSAVPPVDGYFTETYCRRSRYFQPANGMRIDAIRAEIDRIDPPEPAKSIALAALLLAADRVDSTTGLQMAYLKQWAPRSYHPLTLAMPDLLPGAGRVLRMDAVDAARSLEGVDLVYLDPPYNQHSYYCNYHLWETLIRNDRPDVYGVACKRLDCRETRSPFNSRGACREAFGRLAGALVERGIQWLLVSFSDEGYLAPEEIQAALRAAGHVESAAMDHRRYVGAQIGIFNPKGVRVGSPGRSRNQEWLFLVGPDRDRVRQAIACVRPGAAAAA